MLQKLFGANYYEKEDLNFVVYFAHFKQINERIFEKLKTTIHAFVNIFQIMNKLMQRLYFFL